MPGPPCLPENQIQSSRSSELVFLVTTLYKDKQNVAETQRSASFRPTTKKLIRYLSEEPLARIELHPDPNAGAGTEGEAIFLDSENDDDGGGGDAPDAGCISEVHRLDAAENAVAPPLPHNPPVPAAQQDDALGQDVDVPADLPPPLSAIKLIRLMQEYIRLVEAATLDKDSLDDDILDRLRNPLQNPVDVSDPATRLSLDIFLASSNASEETYDAQLFAEIFGVVSVAEDMCINSDHAYTGPFAKRDTCFICGEHRYNQD
ncbi:hypothetical protein ONZ45_g652 [Pleurotus djamor]|nr:hypothetical protein ONZ45_g652 [Pleurotus djamor]